MLIFTVDIDKTPKLVLIFAFLEVFYLSLTLSLVSCYSVDLIFFSMLFIYIRSATCVYQIRTNIIWQIVIDAY